MVTTLADCWRVAHAMIVTDHAIEQYVIRSENREASGAEIESTIRAEFIRCWRKHHVEIVEDGFERLCVKWKSEPLVSFIKPLSADGPPVVVTILTRSMFDRSLATGRYRRRS